MNFINPTRLDSNLVGEMDAYESYLSQHFPGSHVVVHEDWADQTGHVADSQHYLGKAVDFHVVGVSALEAWLALERFKFGGIGYYPEWKPVAGFHADVREVPFRARWARTTGADGEQQYVALDRAILKGMVL